MNVINVGSNTINPAAFQSRNIIAIDDGNILSTAAQILYVLC
jgi:hypothetical protein